MKLSLRNGFYLIALLLAIALIILGLSLSDPYKNTLLALGSAILGAVLSLIFAAVTQQDVVALIYDKIFDRFGFHSDEPTVEHFRTVLHHYHLTQLGGAELWRYRRYNFAAGSKDSGRLTTSVIALDNLKHAHRYDIAAGCRDERFIIFEKNRSSGEPTIVEIYPHMRILSLGVFAGIGFMQTWDGTHFVTKCMLSQEPLLPIEQEGDIDQANWAALDKCWHDAMTRQGDKLALA